MNTPRAVTILGGTFLFWISARGRFPKYSALVNRDGVISPSPGAGGGGTATPLASAAAVTNDVVGKVWDSFKAQ